MKLIQSPNHITGFHNSIVIFLGGEITGCPNWQQIVIEKLKYYECVLINPKRKDWDINDNTLEEKQIKWEHQYLNMADTIVFWFPKESVCPIALFELGKYVRETYVDSNGFSKGKELHIGCHPEYSRINDVKIQVGLERPYQIIHESLDSLIQEISLDLINDN